MKNWLKRAAVVRVVALMAAFLSATLLVATPADVSTLTYPANNATSVGLPVTFQWTAVPSVEYYYLYVGTTVGAKDVVDTGGILQTSWTATSLPGATTLYARLWTRVGGVWRYADSTFTTQNAPPPPVVANLTYPANNAPSVALPITFQWTTVPSVEYYYLYVGTTVGAKNVVDTGGILQTSWTATGLPNGTTLYVRLWTKAAGAPWRYVDSTFTTAPTLVASLTYPANNATSVGLPVAFQWTIVPSAESYYLYVGTTVGAKNIVDTGGILQTSWTSTALPGGTLLYVRLWTKLGGVWRYVDSTFTTQNVVPPPVLANLTYPLNDASSVAVPTTFQWTSVPGVEFYYLYVGTTQGATDVVNSHELLTTSFTAHNLPGNSTLHARLWTKVGGIWRYVDTKFGTQATVARLSYPVTGLTVSTDVTFTWNPITGADGYTLAIGTSVGASNVLQVPEQTGTSAPLTNLPQGQLLYARLGTHHDGAWHYSDSTFSTIITRAVLITPADAATSVSAPKLFQWTSVDDAQAYRLQVGSSTGTQNVLDSGETTQTQWTVPLPDSSTLHARLWTKLGGVWRYVDSTFSTVALRARFIHPAVGTIAVDPGQPFQWTSAVNADGYTLQIGSTWGSNELLDTGEIQALSYLSPGLPADQTLYARIWTRIGSVSRFDDTMFTLENPVAPSEIVEPADGQSGFGTGLPFRWMKVDLARGYRLRIGSTPGTADLHDSGEIFVTRRFVRNLPVGVTLYGQVQTHIGNAWTSADFSFSVGSTAASDSTTVDTALWATAEIRQMADAQNQAMPWSALGSALNPTQLGMATAGDFTQALLTALSQINSGAQSRRLDIAFTPGTSETHALVEFRRPDTSTWMLLDPMFGLTVNHTLGGASATSGDVSTATVAQSWSDVSYQFLAPSGNAYVTAHYIDYPLLYLNIYSGGVPPPSSPSPAPYLLEVSTPVSTSDIYIIGCEGLPQVSAIIDGQTVTVACGGPDTTSSAFQATSTAVPPGGAFQVFTLRRFVF